MTTQLCGCSPETCGCCAGTQPLTPAATWNRPGLGSLRYRVGTHGAFFETMLARLATLRLDAPGADGQTVETFQPLLGLTTRDPGDPAIALLDGWATLADVLTFYQERIANEGYLRTATERRSVLELARLVGYALRPGVAATVYLAYTLEDKQTEPVEIPAGARAQSVPGPGELPQAFETSEKLAARAAWNDLAVRRHRPQNITLANALTVEKIYVAGVNTTLRTGDPLLLVFGDAGEPCVVRTVVKTEGRFAEKQTEIELLPVALPVAAAAPVLAELVATVQPLVTTASSGPTQRALAVAEQLLRDTYLGLETAPPDEWAQQFIRSANGPIDSPVQEAIKVFGTHLEEVLKNLPAGAPGAVVTDPSRFVDDLLKPPISQAASSARLGRTLRQEFDKNSDPQAQLLVNFAPRLQESYYAAWANANVNPAAPSLQGIYALRVAAPLFGASVPKQATYYFAASDAAGDQHNKGELRPQKDWLEWDLADDESATALFLDQAHEAILPGGYVLVQKQVSGPTAPLVRRAEARTVRLVRQVASARTATRTAYGISGKTTALGFAQPWRNKSENTMEAVRGTLVFGQSEALTLAEEPLTAEVRGSEVELAGLYKELASGRWVIFSGERTDIPGVSGVRASELLMIAGLRHDFDPTLPGDKTHTTLRLATPTAYAYRRDTLTIYGNVAKATHGETRQETLGAGDGSQAWQAFDLKQPPLTFVPAPTRRGVDSTLQIYVNDVEWHESDTFVGLGPKDRKFITKTDDNAKTAVLFGNGVAGARLPTGLENVKAVYRNGIGQPGNVLAEQVSLLQTKPLGVKSVLNPLRASGGADKESRDQGRENAPLAVLALDRLVSVQDYADFTRTFAGIAKADARSLSDGHRTLVHVTIAGADDIPIDPESDLYRNLLAALRKFGDADLPLRVESRELLALVLSAKVRLEPIFLWEPVAKAIRAALLDAFGFATRALGQPAQLSEAISVIQNTAGVAYVDVDAFGGIPEKLALPGGARRLLGPEELAAATRKIADAAPRVAVNVADFERGALRPAQLAIFTPAVPATLILTQIV